MRQVDARGLSCPQPVLLTRKALDAGPLPLEILVDSATARDNVRRMAEKAGCIVTASHEGEDFKLTLSR